MIEQGGFLKCVSRPRLLVMFADFPPSVIARKIRRHLGVSGFCIVYRIEATYLFGLLRGSPSKKSLPPLSCNAQALE